VLVSECLTPINDFTEALRGSLTHIVSFFYSPRLLSMFELAYFFVMNQHLLSYFLISPWKINICFKSQKRASVIFHDTKIKHFFFLGLK